MLPSQPCPCRPSHSPGFHTYTHVQAHINTIADGNPPLRGRYRVRQQCRCFLFRGAATYAGAVDCHGSHMLNAYPTQMCRIHRSISVLPCADHRFTGSHPPDYFLRTLVVCGHATMCFSPMLRIQKDSVQPIQHKGLRYAPAVGYAINSEGSSGARAWATCDG